MAFSALAIPIFLLLGAGPYHNDDQATCSDCQMYGIHECFTHGSGIFDQVDPGDSANEDPVDKCIREARERFNKCKVNAPLDFHLCKTKFELEILECTKME